MFSPVYESRVQYASLQHLIKDITCLRSIQWHPQPLLLPFTCRVYHQLLELLGNALGCLAFMAFIRCHRHLVLLCAARYVAFCVSDAAGTTSFWRPSVLCAFFLARQVPPASGAPLCSMLPVVPFVRQVPPVSGALLRPMFLFLRGRYHHPLAPLRALCCFSGAPGTTSLWCHSVFCVSFLALRYHRPLQGSPCEWVSSLHTKELKACSLFFLILEC